jgi:predicted MFS family arabinose efflux permease
MARKPMRRSPRCEAHWRRNHRRLAVLTEASPGRGSPAREQSATLIVFFVAGFAMASFAPLVPFVKARTGVGEGALGLLLLCLGVGSLITMFLAGALAARFGCRRVILASGVPLCLSLPLLASLSDPFALGMVLLVFGGAIGSIDVTMNIQAIIVERDSGRAMMSGFHGLFSVGGIAGSVCMTAALGAGASPIAATLGVVAVIIVALVRAAPRLLAHASEQRPTMFAVPRGIVLIIGVLCFVAFQAEGAVLDWSGVYLSGTQGMATAYAGLGYVAFTVAMTIGRLTGDRIVGRFGGTAVILFGGLCSASGFALTSLASSWQPALIGFALIGLGCSNIVPVLFTRVGMQTLMPEHIAVSAISTLGYSGILTGPALIGLIAQVSSLSTAFLILAVLQLGVAASGRVTSHRRR